MLLFVFSPLYVKNMLPCPLCGLSWCEWVLRTAHNYHVVTCVITWQCLYIDYISYSTQVTSCSQIWPMNGVRLLQACFTVVFLFTFIHHKFLVEQKSFVIFTDYCTFTCQSGFTFLYVYLNLFEPVAIQWHCALSVINVHSNWNECEKLYITYSIQVIIHCGDELDRLLLGCS